jgi:uncharacterized protein YbaR (Trm112 family)
MKSEYIKYLVCPKGGSDLEFKEIKKEISGRIESGLIVYSKCSAVYEIINGIEARGTK